MNDCNAVRKRIAGCPPCCPYCHDGGFLQTMRLEGGSITVCCAVVTSALVFGAKLVDDGMAERARRYLSG